MAEFLETNEFAITPGKIMAIWNEAPSLGWTGHGGDLLGVDGAVSRSIFEEGRALGSRFEREGEVVGLHVYSSSLVAQLTVPVEYSQRCLEFVRMVERVVGTTLSIDHDHRG